GADVVSELLRGVEVLHALTRYRRHEGLRQFREQFTQRYETREVPLALALDEENGIGFERSSSPAAEAAPLLAGLPLSRGQDQSAQWTRRDTFLLGKLTRALATGSGEITVEASEAAAVRASDIPYLGRSGAPAGRQLPLADLLVSVQGERIVLRSRRLGREVIPRLTTAHNHSGRGLGVYRFLCALQSQQVTPGITWDWGPLGQ